MSRLVRLVDYSSSEDSEPEEYDGVTTSDLRIRRCHICSQTFPRVVDLQQHFQLVHSTAYNTFGQYGGGETSDPLSIVLDYEALDTYQDYRVVLDNEGDITIESLFKRVRKNLILLLKEKIDQYKNYKVQFIVEMHFEKIESSGAVRQSFPIFRSFLFGVNSNQDIGFVLRKSLLQFKDRIENFTQLTSNLNFKSIKKFLVCFAENRPFSAGSPLPNILQRKLHSLIDVPGDDDLCFKRCVHLHSALRPPFPNITRDNIRLMLKRVSYYDQLFADNTIVDWTGITFPFQLSQIRRFEKQNPSVALTIIGYDPDFNLRGAEESVERSNVNDTIDSVVGEDPGDVVESRYMSHKKLQNDVRQKCFILHSCKDPRPIRIDLLMNITPHTNHFLFIKSLHGLLFLGTRTAKEVCRFCLHRFTRGRIYDEHVGSCAELGLQKTSFPVEKLLYFKHYKRTIRRPFIAFGDFESTLQELPQPALRIGSKLINVHSPGAYAWISINNENELSEKSAYHASSPQENVAKRMINELVDLCKRNSAEIHQREAQAASTMIMSVEQRRQLSDPAFRRQQQCFFCHKGFNSTERIHRHHNHFTMMYEGLAHGRCNMAARQKKNELVIIFNNFKGYDSKLILEGISNTDIIKGVEVIGTSSEKFAAIYMETRCGHHLTFIDSFAFFDSSLDSLTQTLDPEKFKITRKAFEAYAENVHLLLRKGVYPYSYFTSVAKYTETQLPAIQHFRNDLTDTNITQEEYNHALNVFETFNNATLGDYTILYCLTDVTILADYFLQVRGIIYEGYGLDMAHYVSLPQLIYDAALKVTKVTLENIQDPSLYNFFELSIRGGLVSVGDLRACKANNPLLPPEEYDASLPNTWILFLDVNNLYGSCLTDKLPHCNYQWVLNEELEEMRNDTLGFFDCIPDDGDVGYFIEVDVTIPSELHEHLDQFPPMPYRRRISAQEISTHMGDLADDLELGTATFATERLIADFHERKNYICHFRALKQWMKLGCVVTRVHRSVRFTQTAWLKPFIEFNTAKRSSATSTVDSDFWKLASNSCFGKFIENKRARVNVRIITNRERALVYNKKPTIQNFKIIHPNVVLITLKRLEVKLDRPIAVGATCLELSKTHMSMLFYEKLKRIWGTRMRTIYGDTDSFAIYVETQNVYQDLKENEGSTFDLSNYEATHPFFGTYFSNANKKRLGCLKDESPQGPIAHMVVVKPKMYIVRSICKGIDSQTGLDVNSEEYKKVAKGIPKRLVKENHRMEDYLDALQGPSTTVVNFKTIRSFDQILYTMSQTKRGINGFDLKRFILPDNVNTLAFGHVDIARHFS